MSRIPETGLWAGVLHRFFDDARHPSPRRYSYGSSTISISDQERARGWLLGNGRGFREVCDLAGMDPDFILDAAKAFASEGWPPPAEIKRPRRATA